MYDVIIVGAGSAGMAAGIYSVRFGLKTLVLGKVVGGLLNESHNVENYPGYASIPGLDLMMKFKEHCDHLNVPIKEEWVTAAQSLPSDGKHGTLYRITAEDETGVKHEYTGRTLILAMGTKHRKLGAKNEEKLSGRGVSYCATCDAAFYKNVPVAIIGGGDSAAQAGDLVAQFASHVFMLVRKDKMRAEPINVQRLEQNPKVTIIYNTNALEALGDKMLTGIKLSTPYNGSDVLPVEGMFIEIGHDVQSELAAQLGVELNDHGEIKIDAQSQTNLPGVYAAGDVADRPYKQAITGVAEGVIAAFGAYSLVKKRVSGKDLGADHS